MICTDKTGTHANSQHSEMQRKGQWQIFANNGQAFGQMLSNLVDKFDIERVDFGI